jgi:hypothetical protein
MSVREFGAPKRITATGLVAGGVAMSNLANPSGASENTLLEGAILGFYVANTSSGTLTLWDGQSAVAPSTQITGLITPAIGWNPLPVAFKNGLWAVITGTLDVTFAISG